MKPRTVTKLRTLGPLNTDLWLTLHHNLIELDHFCAAIAGLALPIRQFAIGYRKFNLAQEKCF